MNAPAEIPFQQLLDALLDEDNPFHPRFLYRLSDLDDKELGMFQEIWPRVSSWRRKALMEDLETLGERDYLLDFESLGRVGARDEDGLVRTAALRILWEYEDFDLSELFLELLEHDPEPLVRAAAASGLGRYIYLGELDELPDEARRRLEDTLISTASGEGMELVRRRALEALGYSSREEVIPLIETAFATGEKDWLSSALYAMGRSANDQWEERVISMLLNTHPSVRLEAARAAGELELKESVEYLLELLEDPNDDVRFAAIWSLSQIGGEGVREALVELQVATEDDEELELIDSALDNLSFTEDLELFTMFDIPGGVNALEEEDEELIELEDDEVLFDGLNEDDDILADEE